MGRLRQQFAQYSKLLADKFAAQGSDSSDVAARPIEAGDKTLLNRVAPITENDRNCIGRSLGCTDRKVAAESHNHAHPTADQIGGQLPQRVRIVIGPLILDLQVLAFDVASIVEPLPKSR